MYISKLSLYGFKSFLRKSEIEFGQGITSIVGPNGCGKTNIVDAIRWVIGEQKSRVLRADRSTDIIFNGTANKRPLNLSEVSLTIHNVSGRLPIQYRDITITRRIYRNGESEYFINNSLCRLKDITDLFIDTGMGSNAYSIIELKMIENMLSENPDDRKKLFEEAAGVNKYREQRKAALRKLEATQDDLVRLKDIITEVSSNVRNLRAQLRRYEKYQETTQNLIEAEISLVARKVWIIHQNLDPLTKQREQILKAKEAYTSNLNKKEQNWQILQTNIEAKEIQLQESVARLDSTKDELGKLNTRDLLFKEQLNNINQTIDRLTKEEKSIIENISRANQRIQDLQQKQEGITTQHTKNLKTFEQLTEVRQVIEAKYRKAESHIQGIQNDRYLLMKQQAEVQANYQNLKENISQRETEHSSINKQLQNQNIAFLKTKEEIADYGNRITTAQTGLQSQDEEKATIQQRFDEQIQKKTELSQQLMQLNNRFEQLNEQAQFFSSLIQSKEGFSPGLQYVLDHLPDFPGVKGALSDLIKANPEYYPAIEAVIKNISSLLVASDTTSAIETIKKLGNLHKGRISVIPLDIDFHCVSDLTNISVRYKVLKEQIQSEKQLKPLINFLFHQIYYCPDDEFDRLVNDVKFSGISLVTEKGRFKDSRGFLTGGSESSTANLLIGRKARLHQLEQELDQIRSKKKSIQKEIENYQNLILKSRNLLSAILEKSHSAEKSIHEFTEQLRIAETKQLQVIDYISDLEERKLNLHVALDNFRNRLAKETPANEDLSRKIKFFDQELSSEREKIDVLTKELNQKNDTIQNTRVELVQLENEKRSIIDNIVVIKRNIENQAQRRNQILQEIAKNNLLGNDISQKARTNQKTISDLQGSYQKLEIEVQDKREKFQQLRHSLQKLNEDLFILRHEKENLTNQSANLELQISEYTGLEKELKSVLREKYNRAIPEPIPEDLPEENELQRQVDHLKNRIEQIGMVNLTVKEEYEKENARLQFLSEQRDDLIQSEQGLNDVITHIDDVARQQFVDIFAKIQQNFNNTFNIFFGGGEADVRLIGNEDPLEANIEIWACPGGKKMKSLRMLSAGEKTLTAIALLFAIYQVKPSPFCILDEVDAPLDDENTRRFNNVLRTFSLNTQFIVVTHNKLTMSISDALYGVTMGEKGVSQIVSVKLE